MASVLLVACPDEYAALLPTGADATRFVEGASAPEGFAPDLIVIGPATAEPSVVAQSIGQRYPEAEVLIAAPGDSVSRVSALLRTTPYIPLRTDLVCSEPAEAVGRALVRAVARCEVRSGHRRVLKFAQAALDESRAAVLRDATHVERAEMSLRQARKMEAMGRLAGGIAHDFNNMLTVILAHASLLAEALSDDDRWSDDVTQMVRAAERAQTFTRQLLAFSRRQPLRPRVIDTTEAIHSIERRLSRTLPAGVEILLSSGASVWPISVDPGHFEQLLVNLASNARDAMPDGGRLTIEVENAVLDQPWGTLATGDYVTLRVSDTGHGIPAHLLDQVFEPFFTTKERGQGVGLSLATCYSVMQQAGGDIVVSSPPEGGATFELWFPRALAEREKRPDVPPAREALRGSETLLLVEDEPAILAVTARALRAQGYRVLEAADGQAAKEILDTDAGTIAMVVTDVVMPRMSGPELARHIEGERPGLKVLFMTGYADEQAMRHNALGAGAPVLVKPFLPKDLLREVRKLLDA